MKLLLVDDERYVIESIKKNICWERTGITEIYTAFTMKQAQEIITAVKMDIIISDIVMPAATGFDLVQWVREQNFRIQVIFFPEALPVLLFLMLPPVFQNQLALADIQRFPAVSHVLHSQIPHNWSKK